VNEHVVTLLAGDKAEALLRIEKLHCSSCQRTLTLRQAPSDIEERS
jgi:hypothetical protein